MKRVAHIVEVAFVKDRIARSEAQMLICKVFDIYNPLNCKEWILVGLERKQLTVESAITHALKRLQELHQDGFLITNLLLKQVSNQPPEFTSKEQELIRSGLEWIRWPHNTYPISLFLFLQESSQTRKYYQLSLDF